MRHQHKKAKTNKKVISPKWEEEELTDLHHVDSKAKEEAEAQLFYEAIASQTFTPKDAGLDNATHTPATRATKSSLRHSIDLHGMTVAQAQAHVIRSIESLLIQAKGQPIDIRIITGKGHHSKGRQPQLISEIHHIVESKFRERIISIEVSPHELKLGGTYLKGHFDVKLR